MRNFKNFGSELKELRTRQGHTQESLGALLKVHKQFVSNAERAQSGLPRPAIKRLAEKFPSERRRIFAAMAKDYEVDRRQLVRQAHDLIFY